MFKHLLPCVGRYKKYVLWTLCLVAGEVFFEILIPFMMSRIIDIGILKRDRQYILYMGFLMITMALFALICGGLAARCAAVAGTGFAKEVRRKLFFKIQDFSFANVDKFSTGSLVTRLTSDVNNVQLAFMMSTRILLRAPLMLVCAVAMSIFINARLALIFFAAIPVLGLTFYAITSKAYARYREMLKKYDRLNTVVQENLIGIRLVKAFAREDYEYQKFRDAADDVRSAQVNAERLLTLNMPAMQFVMYACLIAIFWFGGNMAIGGTMLTGELMGFLSYVTQILLALMLISMIFITLILSKASIFRIVEVLEEEPTLQNKATGVRMDIANGSVSFEHVSFSYTGAEENSVLKDIHFSIGAGQTLGIIGGTGSSKSTLAQLILRLYDVSGGLVRVGGQDVREYDLTALRNSVALVLQKNILFSGTIRENLKWGNENASEEMLVEACQVCDAHDFITAFPDGYDTELGQGGVNLSGGQKQRICIARALLKKPKIIILDDSTSAVDTGTEARIRSSLKSYLAKTTTIIISQRITSVQDADKIIVMDGGRIDAIGTHDELLKSNVIYREVSESQRAGMADRAED